MTEAITVAVDSERKMHNAVNQHRRMVQRNRLQFARVRALSEEVSEMQKRQHKKHSPSIDQKLAEHAEATAVWHRFVRELEVFERRNKSRYEEIRALIAQGS